MHVTGCLVQSLAAWLALKECWGFSTRDTATDPSVDVWLPVLQADAVAATVTQRDANATWEAVAGEFGAVLAQYREMLGGNEDVILFCAKRVIKRNWDQNYLNRVSAGRCVC